MTTSDADESTTVAVVGAGLAGLTAARALAREGIDTVVLDAADRVGGRSMSETSSLGTRLDLGGQWIGHDHHRLMRMGTELGMAHFPMHTGRLPALVRDGRRLSPASPAVIVGGIAVLVADLLARVPRVADRWNDVTLRAGIDRVPGATARRLLDVLASTSWTADLDRFSVAAMARMICGQGGIRTILSTSGGAQDSLFVDGAGSIAERLAADLGDRVRTGRRVTGIRHDDDGVTVRTTSGDLRAARVIVTVPPPLVADIAFTPELPPDRAAVADDTYMGSVYKAIAVYPEPFWRARATGETIVLDDPGCAVFDSSPPRGAGHLCLLVAGPEARALDDLDVDDRRTLLLGRLAAHLGGRVTTPVDWHEKSWHRDGFVGGGYLALPEPGTATGIAPLASDPIGRIHWAGSETAAEHPGYLEGAIASGDRAAGEVTDALRRQAGPRAATPSPAPSASPVPADPSR